jgi:hypothetical protein
MEHSLAKEELVVNGTVSDLGNQAVHQQQAFGSAEGPFFCGCANATLLFPLLMREIRRLPQADLAMALPVDQSSLR